MNQDDFQEWLEEPEVDKYLSVIMVNIQKAIAQSDEIEFRKWLSAAMMIAFDAGKVAQMIVDVDADAYESMTISQLAAEIKRLKENVDDFSAVKAEWQKAYDYLTISVVPERMDEEDIGTMKVNDVGRLQVASDIRCSVPAANKEALQEWLEENGHESMIASTVNSSTLKAFVKEMMKEKKPYPKDLLKVEPYSRATVVKA